MLELKVRHQQSAEIADTWRSVNVELNGLGPAGHARIAGASSREYVILAEQ